MVQMRPNRPTLETRIFISMTLEVSKCYRYSPNASYLNYIKTEVTQPAIIIFTYVSSAFYFIKIPL